MKVGQALAQAVGSARRRLNGKPRQGIQAERPRVRLGNDEAAYAVCPTGLSSESVVYSFGIGEDLSFDLAMIERFGVVVHAFDPTPRAIAWARAQALPPGLVLHEWGLADYDGVAHFTPPEDPSHVSHTLLPRESARPAVDVPVRRLETIARELGHQRVDVLKMDVEGAEYGVIDALKDAPLPVDQILLEFHHHLAGVPLSRTERAIARLNRAGYRIFDVAESGREFSFIRC